ncbi:fibrobacter succinogenes major paralogous domain-containing protein [uncultured Fibrobacter sp.]|uniref:fibrobacter succinogenes major paralogous domain-containing protein n=1 Tax=uncultured Fibrobacter sp. TaxID=261512 RepID=UPI002623EF8C|nr:fibrobacter succinogenes major paralogous domain-containing protein [uncultured Fibrobacter sp.]
MRKSFQRVIATLNLFQGKQSLTIFMLAAIFALSACDDSSSAGGDDGETSALSSSAKVTEPAEVTDGSSDSNGEAISSSGKTELNGSSSSAKSSFSERSGGDPSSSSVKLSSSSAKSSSSSMSKVESSSSEKVSISSSSWGVFDWSVPKEAYLNPEIQYDSIVDERDGQVYKTIKIGDQTWMAQNLNYAYTGVKFHSVYGTESDSTSWCYNNKAENCAVAGRLYTWAAAIDSVKLATDADNPLNCGYGKNCTLPSMVQGVCPSGWHLPTYDEWRVLFIAVGASSTTATVLKSLSGWNGSGSGSDAYGFSALPAGYRSSRGGTSFSLAGSFTYFWSATEDVNPRLVRVPELRPFVSSLSYYQDKGYAISVRCIKNSE